MTTLRAGTPVTVGSVRITPLERVRVEGSPGRGGLFLFGSKEPVGVVISTRNGERAVDLEGSPLCLDAFREVAG